MLFQKEQPKKDLSRVWLVNKKGRIVDVSKWLLERNRLLDKPGWRKATEEEAKQMESASLYTLKESKAPVKKAGSRVRRAEQVQEAMQQIKEDKELESKELESKELESKELESKELES